MGNNIYLSIGTVIKDSRKKLGLSQEKLGNAAHVDRTFIAKIESGEANPSVQVLYKLATALELKISDLTQGI